MIPRARPGPKKTRAVLRTPPGTAIDDDTTDDMGSVAPARRGSAKTLRDAFRLLLSRTAVRVRAGVRSPATLHMQRQHVRYLLERLPPRTLLEALTPGRIARALDLEASGRRRRLSGGTLRKRASTLSQAIELARGRAPRLPEIPYAYVPRAAFLPDFEAYERLRDALPLERRAWFAVAVWTGQRRSDVERLRREDFDPDAGWIVVRSWKTRRFTGVKIHAAPELARELEARWRELPPGAPLVAPWPHANKVLRRRCDRLGLPRLTTHSLRHTFFTWYVQANGFTPELLEVGGWKDLTIPARVYAHAMPVRFRDQIERTVAFATSTRRGPKKISRKRESGPNSRGMVPTELGEAVLVAPPPPEPSPRGTTKGTGSERSRPPPIVNRLGSAVGPAGIEPAAYGLKVPCSDQSSDVRPSRALPSEGPWSTQLAPAP